MILPSVTVLSHSNQVPVPDSMIQCLSVFSCKEKTPPSKTQSGVSQIIAATLFNVGFKRGEKPEID